MSAIAVKIRDLFTQVEGLPGYRPARNGKVEGWPEGSVRLLTSIIEDISRGDSYLVSDAIEVIEQTPARGLPEDLHRLLSRVLWGSSAAPDFGRYVAAARRGLGVQDALLEARRLM